MLENANQVSRARLLAASSEESGQWLHAIPVPSLGTLLDPETLRIAIALRLGSVVCEPHPCRCGAIVDAHGHHGLSCRFSAGRHSRHAELNDIVRRTLQRAGAPSILEPLGMDRGDGKRPDGVTIFPYKEGRSLCWDCTCVDTFAQSHLNKSAVAAGSAAGEAELKKREKYRLLAERYIFEPIAIETTGVYGPSSLQLVKDIGRRVSNATGDVRQAAWFKQRLGLAVQRGNAFSILVATREQQISSC